MSLTLYWHDYESWGADPRRDKPAQFAGVRTDLDLNPVGEPLMLYCRPPEDSLPHPVACLVTGILPTRARDEGLVEVQFMARIHDQLGRAETCGVGYNSIRFDDELTRYGLYRNFFDPYAREWQNGSSRWDIIDLVRMTRALRPEGIQWPEHEDGTPSYRLEDLTAANGIEHAGAHEALADVRATIELARRVKSQQPRLYDWVFRLRDKRRVAELLDLDAMTPVLHVSSMFPAEYGCLAMVAPIAPHPSNRNGIVVYDLRYDPEPLMRLDTEAIRERLFTPKADLPEGVERIPLKTVHLNKCPALAPMGTLTDEAVSRWSIDVKASLRRLDRLKGAKGLSAKIQQVFSSVEYEPIQDPEQALYGGFFGDADRARIARVRTVPPERLTGLDLDFEDGRLTELFFRYRARNFPQTLDPDEQARWRAFCRRRLTNPEAGAGLTLRGFQEELQHARERSDLDPAKRGLLDELEDYASGLACSLGLTQEQGSVH
jgi:exodeoxyribonuclease-1